MARRRPPGSPPAATAPTAPDDAVKAANDKAAAGVAAVTLATAAPATAIVGAGGVIARTGYAVPTEAAQAAAKTAILAALVGYLTRNRQKTGTFLTTHLPTRPHVIPDDIAAVIAEELDRDEEFARKALERVQRDLPRILKIADPKLRETAMRKLLAREALYQRMRAEAMAARAIAAVDRTALRRISPQGAYWKSDPHVKEHTAGCLIMSGGGRGKGRFWPWVVLDRVHPPRHPGCPCGLHSYGDAIENGWLNPADVLDVSDAIRRAAGVVMEAEQADLIAEFIDLDLIRGAAVGAGLVTAERFDAVAGAQYPHLVSLAPFTAVTS